MPKDQAQTALRYTREWERLGDVLARIVKAGSTEQDAKVDICNALADQMIGARVRVEVMAEDDGGAPPGYQHIKGTSQTEQIWLQSQQVKIPHNLKPSDFDWEHSQPHARWLTTFDSSIAALSRVGEEPERRSINLIELRTSDVAKVLVSFGPNNAAERAQTPPASQAEAKGISQKRATELVSEYVKSERQAGRAPSQGGAVKAASNIKGSRDLIRATFNRLCPERGVGRPSKIPAE